MGISVNVYRLNSAQELENIENIDEQLDIAEDTKVDLYKMTEDIAIVLTNKSEPFDDIQSIPYKILFGNPIQKTVNKGEIGGFLPSSEVSMITSWIKENRINTFDGFEKMYDNLSPEVKKELEMMASPDKAELFIGYVKPLTVLYFTALQYNNSVVFVAQ